MNNDFHIHINASPFPVSGDGAYLEEGLCGVCTSGTAVIEVFSVVYRISPNDLLNILPMQLVTIREKSDDFLITYFTVSKTLFIDIMSCIGKVTLDFIFFMRRNFYYHLKESEVRRFLDFCRVIDYRNNNDEPRFRRETIICFLRIYYWEFYIYCYKESERQDRVPKSRKEDIASQFAFLVAEHCKEHREVAFYAGQLCISSIYLTKVIQEIYGQSPYKVIADHIVIEIKALLRNPFIDIKEIVRRVNFANQSSMSRFFRQHTGMAPSQYRQAVLF